ncbi:MAG TPA: S8 family peptidase [Nocardioidaceae bacterium]|nr:S8 family peptidase [Nocardioidaceae bacterium]
MSTSARARKAPTLLAAALLAVPATTAAAAAVPTPVEVASPGLYIVALERPDAGGRATALRAAQDDLLAEVGGPEVLYRYTSALNGFAAELSRDQVKQLRSHPDVVLVERSTTQRTDSVDSPEFLGADQAWAAAGGPEDAGRGTVVGVVDSGIWPENPSFSALPDASLTGPGGFSGECETGEQWDESDCNSKVVSARYFVKGFGEEDLAASEFLSPRDGTGHGSHVAAVAAGNHGVEVAVEGQEFGEASGMAPAARIASYKACWAAPDPADDGCATADTVAAIDQAVTDGVDVLSYAVSGASTSGPDAVELAFLNATAAGVFVATSAGNRGPGESTVAHTSPWVTTVGATTHRSSQGALVLDGDDEFVGAMISDEPVPETGIVLAGSAATATSSAEDARLCKPGTLDADVVQDQVVVCDRGIVARVEKSAAVAQAGGAAMVLANVRPDTVDSDFHAVPTVHVDVAAAEAIKRHVRETVDPRAAIDPTGSDDTPVPQVAHFSSRGPAEGDAAGVLKPDLTAPGVGVLSAVAPPSNGGRLWGQLSGTSMSTAHVAGLGALVMGERPGWTPAMVKSAMSTTADDVEGVSGPRSEGAGQVDAAEVLEPGLVLDAPVRRFRDWLAGRVETRNLNLPSVAVDDLTGTGRVVRRVTNVSGRSESYSVAVTGLDGLGVRVRPGTLTLAPGETRRFVVLVDRGSAQLETAAQGHLVWTGLRHQVRLPVVVTPRTLSAPPEAAGSGASGSVSFEALSGTDGQIDLSVTGLAGATPVGLTLEPGDFDPTAPQADADTAMFPVEVPSGTAVLRLELEGRDSDDLDLHLYREGELVASATGSGADEILTEVEPASGDYELYVTSAVAANGSTTTAQLYTWVVRDKDADNLTVAQSVPVTAGEPFPVDLSWQGLDPTSRWFGAVHYAGSEEHTFVTVN